MKLAGWIALASLSLAVVPARADYQIGSVYFTATGSAERWGHALSDMLDTDLVQQVGTGGKFEKCGVTIIEIKHRADVLKELELQKSDAFDPKSRAQPGKLLDANYVIEGSVQPDGADGVSWTLQVREVASGRIIARDNAGAKLDRILDEPQHIAERLLGQFCKSYAISGNAGPMKVSGTACSLARPFTVSGGGGGMTVKFSYAPSGQSGGKVSYTGGAPRAPMSGAGTYTVTLDGKGGTLKQTHTGKVNIPMGGSATHTDVLKLAEIPPC